MTPICCMSPSPRKVLASPALRATALGRHRGPRANLGTPCQSMEVTPSRWPYDGRMAVVESAENQGAWEQRRVLVALRIELAGLRLIRDRGLDDVTVEQI